MNLNWKDFYKKWGYLRTNYNIYVDRTSSEGQKVLRWKSLA